MAAYAYTMRGDAPPQRPDVPDAERCALDASLPLQGDNV
jgi:hypothetical protein